jgi:lipid-A-disaccharide synthase-like uncharacterized protein
MIDQIQAWLNDLMSGWQWWYAFGFLGQLFFFARFGVQWLASEKKKQSVIPISFWYFSLLGSSLLLIYAIGKIDVVFVLGQSTNGIIYIRNLMFIHKKKNSELRGLTIR